MQRRDGLDADTCCRALAVDGRGPEEHHWNMEEGKMNLEGVKVFKINPGLVYLKGSRYRWTAIVNGRLFVHSEADYETAAAAKAAMRDEVYRLRKIHLPE